jgi:coproporphyrinogen III oxidase-like Fe-S oxidoreductase
MNNEAWIHRRTALHDRYLEVARVGDASRLAYLHGPERLWTQEEVAGMWDNALRTPLSRMNPLNSVYVHVPFCKSICHFCNYDRLQPSSPLLLKTWLARVLRSIEVIGPKLRPLNFHALYIGGGTPSVLPGRMLHELLEALDRTLTWDRRASRKMEFDPAVMNRDRLQVLAAHGVKELSFGIETLDPAVNASHNRGRQGIELIEKSFADLKAVGMRDVACDFLLGLEGTTPEGMLVEIETVLRRFEPKWVDIFMLTPTQSYVTSHFGGSWEACFQHISRFEAVVPAALPALAERTGFVVRSGHGHHMMLQRGRSRHHQTLPTRIAWAIAGPLLRFMAKSPRTRLFYTPLSSEARRPVNVFGIGRSARSGIFGNATFAAHDPEDNPAMEGPASYVGHTLDATDEARTYLSHLLRDNDTVNRDEFSHMFGGDMMHVIPEALAGWQHDGTAQLEEDALRFVPQDRRERIRSLLWLVPEEAIEFDLAHFDQLELSPSGIAGLIHPLKVGTGLAGGHTFEGADGTRLLVRTPLGELLRLRIAPALTEGSQLRLVLDSMPNGGEDDTALGAAVARLRGVLTNRHRELSGRPARRG